ncbi:MAG: hypothetical protein Q6K70_03190 [Thermostichales cyanobacterium DRC_bins_46]
MPAKTKSTTAKATRKGFSWQPILWTAGVILTVWYLTPSHWYAQATRVQLDAVYRPATRL